MNDEIIAPADAVPAQAVVGEVIPAATPVERLRRQGFQAGFDPRRNMAGRKMGSKQLVGEAFLKDLVEWHRKHGKKAIEKVGREKPEKLLEIMASLIPKDTNVDVNVKGGLVLGTIELQEVERRTHELLRRIENGFDSPPRPD